MDYLPVLVRYHIGVNERILERSAKLTEEFRRPETTTNGSAYDTFDAHGGGRLGVAGVLHRQR